MFLHGLVDLGGEFISSKYSVSFLVGFAPCACLFASFGSLVCFLWSTALRIEVQRIIIAIKSILYCVCWRSLGKRTLLSYKGSTLYNAHHYHLGPKKQANIF